ncbi:MAG: cold shock domain-containing protein [Candidatus Acidiferrales bacterium]
MKSYFADRGFGLIQPMNGDDLIFVHYSNIKSDAKALLAGQMVEFDLKLDGSRRKATNVKIVG